MAKQKGQPADVPLDKIVVLPEFQVREGGIDDEHADSIAEAVRAKRPIARITVWVIEGIEGFLVTRGHHRFEGYRRAGRTKMPVLVRHGTRLDAMLDAASGNAGNLALPMRREDKRKAVRRTFEELTAAGESLSDQAIVDLLEATVSREFVRQMRPARNVASPNGEPEGGEERTGADGKRHKVRTRKVAGEDAETTRTKLARDVLTAQPRVWVALRGGCDSEEPTVGALVDRLAAGEDFGLRASDLGDVREALEGFMRYARTPGSERAKPGSSLYDWKELTTAIGQLIRQVDAITYVFPATKESKHHKRALATLNMLLKVIEGEDRDGRHIEGWRDELLRPQK